jgi:hypothetical protein
MTSTAAVLPGAAMGVTPLDGGTVGGTTVAVDDTAGDQLDPHVSGDLAAYTDAADPALALIRYYDFLSAVSPNASIPAGPDDIDTLSDVNSGHIAFARYNTVSGVRACMVFDVASHTTIPIGSATQAGATALGGDTVAFANGSPGEIMVGSISNPGGALTDVSASGDNDVSPAVSPNGSLIAWASCTGFSCSIMKSTRSAGVWSAPALVRAAPAANPDTDGTNIVYDAPHDVTDDSSRDIFFQPVGGGAETQIVLPGVERNPSISGGVIAFEGATEPGFAADVYVYQIGSNKVFRVTNTGPTAANLYGIDETLNDVTVLPNGDVRVVWAADDDSSEPFARNIYARTFTLPPVPAGDTTLPSVTITTPADGAVYTKNQLVLADYACEDEPGGSGVASCDGPVASGDPIDTASIGNHDFTVDSADIAGNPATVTNVYGVVFPVGSSAFSSPVDDLPVLNSVKAGQSVPVKFGLGGDQGLAIFAPGYPKSQLVPCDSTAPVDGIEETLTAGGSSLTYDASTGVYKYVWKTDKSWSGTCRQLVLGLVDGTFRRAGFLFR